MNKIVSAPVDISPPISPTKINAPELTEKVLGFIKDIWDLETLDPQALAHFTKTYKALSDIYQEQHSNPFTASEQRKTNDVLLRWCQDKLLLLKLSTCIPIAKFSEAYAKSPESEEPHVCITVTDPDTGKPHTLFIKFNPFTVNEKVMTLLSSIFGIPETNAASILFQKTLPKRTHCPFQIQFKVEGRPLSECPSGIEKTPNNLLEKILVLAMAVFTRDAHPDNFFVTPDGHIVTVDCKATLAPKACFLRRIDGSSEPPHKIPTKSKKKRPNPKESAQPPAALVFPFNSALLNDPAILKKQFSRAVAHWLRQTLSLLKHIMNEIQSFSPEETQKLTTVKNNVMIILTVLTHPDEKPATVGDVLNAVCSSTFHFLEIIFDNPEWLRGQDKPFTLLNTPLDQVITRLLVEFSVSSSDIAKALTRSFYGTTQSKEATQFQTTLEDLMHVQLNTTAYTQAKGYSKTAVMLSLMKKNVMPTIAKHMPGEPVFIEDPH